MPAKKSARKPARPARPVMKANMNRGGTMQQRPGARPVPGQTNAARPPAKKQVKKATRGGRPVRKQANPRARRTYM